MRATVLVVMVATFIAIWPKNAFAQNDDLSLSYAYCEAVLDQAQTKVAYAPVIPVVKVRKDKNGNIFPRMNSEMGVDAAAAADMVNRSSSNSVPVQRGDNENYWGKPGVWMCAVDLKTPEEVQDILRGSMAQQRSSAPLHGGNASEAVIALDGPVPPLQRYTNSEVASASSSEINVPVNCHETGAYLDATLPRSSNATLGEIRSQIVSQKIFDLIESSRKRGLTPQGAIEQMLNDARELDRSFSSALSAFNDSTALASLTDDEFLNELRSDKYGSATSYDGAAGSALLAAISTKIGAIATRSFARDMRCWLNAGAWAK